MNNQGIIIGGFHAQLALVLGAGDDIGRIDNLANVRKHVRIFRGNVRIHRTLPGIHKIVGCNGVAGGGPLGILAQVESPGQAVFTALPLCSQRRYKVGILIHFHQCVVDLTEDIAVAVRSGLPRYQGGNRHVGADDQLIGVFYHFTTGAGPAAVIVVVFLVIAAIFGTGAEQHHRGQSQRNQGHPFFLQHNLLSYLCVLLGPGCLPGTSSAVLPPSGLALCLRPLLFLCFYLLTLYLYVRDYHKLYKK